MTERATADLTVKQAIQKIRKEASRHLPNKDADVMALIEHIIELNETGILQAMDRKLTPAHKKRLTDTIKRIQNDEPVEYITKIAHFYGHRFKVSKDTLIPRIETETLVSLASSVIYEKIFTENRTKKLNIVDVGTGTGCIIISLALSLREPANFYATEISEKAHSIAKTNISAYKLNTKVNLKSGNLLDPISKRTNFDIIVANLPYIPLSDMPVLAKSVRNYEPEQALNGGINGASIIRELLIQASTRIKPGGTIVLELQPKLAEKVTHFAHRFYPEATTKLIKDTFDVDRFLIIKNP